jgi:hypothetical protein
MQEQISPAAAAAHDERAPAGGPAGAGEAPLEAVKAMQIDRGAPSAAEAEPAKKKRGRPPGSTGGGKKQKAKAKESLTKINTVFKKKQPSVESAAAADDEGQGDEPEARVAEQAAGPRAAAPAPPLPPPPREAPDEGVLGKLIVAVQGLVVDLEGARKSVYAARDESVGAIDSARDAAGAKIMNLQGLLHAHTRLDVLQSMHSATDATGSVWCSTCTQHCYALDDRRMGDLQGEVPVARSRRRLRRSPRHARLRPRQQAPLPRPRNEAPPHDGPRLDLRIPLLAI